MVARAHHQEREKVPSIHMLSTRAAIACGVAAWADGSKFLCRSSGAPYATYQDDKPPTCNRAALRIMARVVSALNLPKADLGRRLIALCPSPAASSLCRRRDWRENG